LLLSRSTTCVLPSARNCSARSDSTTPKPNVTSGRFSVVLKALPGAKLGIHYHVGTVRGYTMRGHWRYLEHDWIAKPGTFIYEPAGEAHTLVATDDSPEPVLVFFAVEGGLIYFNQGSLRWLWVPTSTDSPSLSCAGSTIERPISMCASWTR